MQLESLGRREACEAMSYKRGREGEGGREGRREGGARGRRKKQCEHNITKSVETSTNMI